MSNFNLSQHVAARNSTEKLHHLFNLARRRGLKAYIVDGMLLVWCRDREYVEIRTEDELRGCKPSNRGANDNGQT